MTIEQNAQVSNWGADGAEALPKAPPLPIDGVELKHCPCHHCTNAQFNFKRLPIFPPHGYPPVSWGNLSLRWEYFYLCWKPVFAPWKDPHLRSDDRYGLTTAYWVFFTIFFIATMLVLAVSTFNKIANLLSSFIRRSDIKSEWMPPIIPLSGADLHPGGSSLWSQDPLECWWVKFSLWNLFCWQLRWE